MMLKVWTTVLIFAFGLQAHAAPLGRDNFLTHGPGAVEAAMGESVVATVGGPAGLYYNSAGLGLGDSGITGEYTHLMPQVSYSWLGTAMDLSLAHLGLGIINLDLGDVTGHTTLSDSGTNLSSYERAYLIGAAREVLPGLFAGSTLGLLDYNLAGISAGGYFADLGTLYRLSQEWCFGLTIKNFYFSGLDFGDGKEIYPREFRLGAAWQKDALVISAQANKTMDGSSPVFILGSGYSIYNIMSLRAGFNGYPTFGLGFKTTNRLFAVDFAYQAQAVSGSERVSLSYYFNKQEDNSSKDPFTELQDRANSLAKFLTEESRQSLEANKEYEAQDEFEKLLALEPANKNAAAALKALTYRTYPTPGDGPAALKWLRKSRDRAYLTFAVRYGEGDMAAACPAAKTFLQRWPSDGRGGLIRALFADKSCDPISISTSKEAKGNGTSNVGDGGAHDGAESGNGQH